jgi:hypothetical protein
MKIKKTKKDIRPRNSKGQLHGYQEWYASTGEIQLRGISKNGDDIGYQEFHSNIQETEYYIR